MKQGKKLLLRRWEHGKRGEKNDVGLKRCSDKGEKSIRREKWRLEVVLKRRKKRWKGGTTPLTSFKRKNVKDKLPQ